MARVLQQANTVAQQFADRVLALDCLEEGGWAVCGGARWWRAPVKDPVPLNAALATDFTFQGVWHRAGTAVVGYHATQYAHLLGPAAHAAGGRGILRERAMVSGPSAHRGDYGVFFHASPEGASFYVQSSRPQWPAEPMAFLELEACSLKAVRGGMAGRYCATGVPGQLNQKVRVVALWILEEDMPRAADPGPAAFPTRPLAELVPTAVPMERSEAGVDAVACWDYEVIEKTEDLSKPQRGYLHLAAGDRVRALSPAEPGHRGNVFSRYVFACNLESGQGGWVPTLCLHQVGCGVAAYVFGLASRPELNGRAGRVLGAQRDRLVLQLNGQRVAIKEENLRVVDEAIEQFSRPQIRMHPDQGGTCSSWALCAWLRTCATA